MAQTVKATTLALVKTFAKVSSSDHDTELQAFLDSVSVEIESYLDRHFEEKSRTEEYSIGRGDDSIVLRGTPVDSITSIKHDRYWDFSNVDAIPTTDWKLHAASGRIVFGRHFLHGPYFNSEGFLTLQVVYTGGMETSTANLVTEFPGVSTACAMQAGEDYRRRHSLGTSSRAGPGGGTQYEGKHRFLPRVMELLSQHRRLEVT